MRASITRRGEGAHAVAGELTFATVPEVWRRSQDWFTAAVVAIDLAGVDRADSAGLALLLEWLRAGRRHGARVVFEHVPAQIQALARLTALDAVLAAAA